MKNFIIKNGIYHHFSGLYRIRQRKGRNLEINFSSQPGKWQSAGTDDLYEAEEYANAKLTDRGFGTFNSKLTLEKFASNLFLRTDNSSYQYRMKKFGKESQYEYYRSMQGNLDHYILRKFGKTPIQSITYLDIERWYSDLKSYQTYNKELASATKNRILRCFSIVMNEAKRCGIIDNNPCDNVERLLVTNKERDTFTKEELDRLFPKNRSELYKIWFNFKKENTLGTPLQWATYFSIMVDTGFRPGEIAALSKSNFIGNGVYTEYSVIARTREIHHSIKTTRKGQKYKVGVLSSYTLSLVKDLIEQSDDEYIFRIKGRFINPNISESHFVASCKRAGIELNGRVEYCLRHTFDTNMLKNLGDTIKERDVQRLMGHTSHRAEYDHRTATDLINRLQVVKPAVESVREA